MKTRLSAVLKFYKLLGTAATGEGATHTERDGGQYGGIEFKGNKN